MMRRITALLFTVFIIVVGAFTLGKNAGTLTQTFLREGFRSEAVASAEKTMEDGFWGRYHWITLNGAFLRAADIRYIKQADGLDVYKLDNGDLMYACSKADIEGPLDSILKLNEDLKENNSKLLYVQLPFKIQNSDMLPLGSQSYASENAADMVNALKEKGVPVLDIYKCIEESGLDYQDLFYHTDHHWKPTTALFAADRICSDIHDRWGFSYDQDALSITGYNNTKYDDWFLGSMGKRVGPAYAGADDFELLTPVRDTWFEFTAESEKGTITREGPFEESLIDQTKLTLRSFFTQNCYASYIGGDYKINHVHNDYADNDTGVLLIRDSFSCALEPFLCMNYRDVTAIDLRHYTASTLKEHVNDNKYDIVIIAYNPFGLLNDKFFAFGY